MRRLTLAAVMMTLLLAPAGCKRKRKAQPRPAEDDGQLATVVHVADPRATAQLIRGFHDVEGNAWRWTMSKFAVTLRPPTGSAQNGATLQLRFTIPEAVIARLKSISLASTVNRFALPSETYTKAGDQTYSREVPASALGADAVIAEFVLDRFLPPSAQDSRELGIIVTTVGFETK